MPEIGLEEPTPEMVIEEPAPEMAFDMSEAEQTPAEMDMDAAAGSMEGAVEDIEDFLSAEDYEYLTIQEGSKTTILMKTSDNNTMALVYDGNEFESLDPSYSKDGKNSYVDIMNEQVKEAIKAGGNSCINRHKGSKVVAK